MGDRIIFRLKEDPTGDRITWKDEDAGVRVLFHKDVSGISATLVSFDDTKYSQTTAERWLANRVAQYSLNSQITKLTPYETALLKALVSYDSKFLAIAENYIGTQAMDSINLNRNTLFNWREFLSDRPVAGQSKKVLTPNLRAMNGGSEIWKLAQSIQQALSKRVKENENA